MINNNKLNQNKKKIEYESNSLELISYLERVKNFPLDRNSFDMFVNFFLKEMIRFKVHTYNKDLNSEIFLEENKNLTIRELRKLGLTMQIIPFNFGLTESNNFVILPNEFHFSYEISSFTSLKVLNKFNNYFTLNSSFIQDNLILDKVSNLNRYNEVFNNSIFSFKFKDGIDEKFFYENFYKKLKSSLKKLIEEIINIRQEDYLMLLKNQLLDDKLLNRLINRLETSKRFFGLMDNKKFKK